MNLLGQAQLAVFNLNKAYAERDLEDYYTALKYAKPSMPVFEKLLANIEELQEKIKLFEENIEDIINDPACQ